MGNSNPKIKMVPVYDEPMAEKPISVRLSKIEDAYVRSLPNRTEWLREAIAEKRQREQNLEQN